MTMRPTCLIILVMSDAEAGDVTPYLDLLRRYHTDVTPHSGRHLIDHLVGVYQLLAAWDNPPHICRAGLFHSIYGTNIFTVRSASFSERAVISEAIGEPAERLAFLFCISERPVAFLKAVAQRRYVIDDIVHRQPVTVTPDEIAALIEIETANFLEQPDNPDDIRLLRDTIVAVGGGAPLVSTAAMAALTGYLGAQRAGPTS